MLSSLCEVDETDVFHIGRGGAEETDELGQPFLLAVGQLYRLHLLCSVFVIMEIILDRQGFQKLHGGLRPDFWNSVEKQQFFFSLSCVVKLLSIQLKIMMLFKIEEKSTNVSIYFAVFCFILVRCEDVLHDLPAVRLHLLVASPLLVQLEGQVPRVEEQEQSCRQ